MKQQVWPCRILKWVWWSCGRKKMLASKVALITGAAQGIGLATTRLLLRNGAKVSMLDIMEKVGKRACSELQKEFSPNDVQFLQVDVTDSEQLKSAFMQTKKVFGGIDIIMNNAGIGDEINWKKTVAVNLEAVMNGTYLGLQIMSPDNGGRGGNIINVASFGGLVPMNYAPAYAASKHGVVGFSRSMASFASDASVRVNCLCPEFVNTRMVNGMDSLPDGDSKDLIIQLGLMEPEEIAEAALELIKDTSANGKVMTVTKGKGRRYIRLLGDPKPKL